MYQTALKGFHAMQSMTLATILPATVFTVSQSAWPECHQQEFSLWWK